jgi:t-SNARE complex subunit (syntaxin)
LAEVLEFGHDDHHATKRTAKQIPIAVAARTSRSFSFIIILLIFTKITAIMGRVTAIWVSRKV